MDFIFSSQLISLINEYLPSGSWSCNLEGAHGDIGSSKSWWWWDWKRPLLSSNSTFFTLHFELFSVSEGKHVSNFTFYIMLVLPCGSGLNTWFLTDFGNIRNRMGIEYNFSNNLSQSKHPKSVKNKNFKTCVFILMVSNVSTSEFYTLCDFFVFC